MATLNAIITHPERRQSGDVINNYHTQDSEAARDLIGHQSITNNNINNYVIQGRDLQDGVQKLFKKASPP